MLQLTMKIREMELELLKNLKFLANLKNLNLRSTDIYNLTAECLNITQQMVLHSGFGMPNDLDLSATNALTETEHMAIKVFACKRKNLLKYLAIMFVFFILNRLWS